jgi:Tfx family DNA-binding protein
MADDPETDANATDPETDANATDPETDANATDPDLILERAGFDAATSVLTRRQAEVLALRERNVRQATIADRLGTSRANVSSVEASARDNVAKARETVAFAEALTAPVRVEVDGDTDLYTVPKLVYDACDDAGVKVNHTAPDLMKLVSDEAGEAVQGREVRSPLLIGVTTDGTVRIRQSE